MQTRNWVAYYRVSTEGQRESGLGLEAQKRSVEHHVRGAGGRIVAEYTEAESGRRADRPALSDALRHCRMAGAVLVIAKLDRLARNVHFLSCLMEAGVEFVACDNPNADRFTIHLLAALAEKEAGDISCRTKAALGSLKARGVPLGSNGVSTTRAPGMRIGDLVPRATTLKNLACAREAKAKADREAYADYLPVIRELRSAGATTRGVAEALNERGYRTRTGKPWNHVQVIRVLALEVKP